jgi:amino acid transporter
MENIQGKKKSFSTAPVFFTAISTILGAILFLRFGFAVGTLGFLGVLVIIAVGHFVTIPTALALSEIATNQRVEGGGEYFIISRSFGLNIGATIGIALYFSQAISVAFYVIAFTEAFEPLFNFLNARLNVELPRQVISIPSMLALSYLILRKGANMGVKTLYIIVSLLVLSLTLFFLGNKAGSDVCGLSPDTVSTTALSNNLFSIPKGSLSKFFIVFAIIFPAFTGMTAGVGLSGDLKNPGRSIPIGTVTATILGMIIYVFVAYKLFISAPPGVINDENNLCFMREITLLGQIMIPIGLAASTMSSAIGSVMVAPRTLQALGLDRSLPFRGFNNAMAKGRGEIKEPFNATVVTCFIALIFVAAGNVNSVAQIITMFFMVTYGSICLISFLHHFGADPSYRPVFKSRWYISLIGFVMCVWLMFKIKPAGSGGGEGISYAWPSIILMGLIYMIISYAHKDRGGLQEIFQSAIFQISRKIQIFIQKSKKTTAESKWRPSAICISDASFERDKARRLLNWISYKYGFGTYIHLIEDYFSKSSYQKSIEILNKLIDIDDEKSNVYLDTIISPSYTSAVAQTIQLPSISGLPNNMIIFEFDKENPVNLKQISENIPLVKAGNLDICVLGSSRRQIVYKQGIHVWIRGIDFENSNLMILTSYIILGHPDWKHGKIRILDICKEEDMQKTRDNLIELIHKGQLPISPNNIELIKAEENISHKAQINSRSSEAGLTVVGFREEQLKYDKELFTGYDKVGDILFVNATGEKKIK